MDRELQQFYEEQFSMFTTKAWKDFMEDLQKIKVEIQTIYSVPDAQSLHDRQGQLKILDLILNRKAMHEKAWEELQSEQNL